MKTTFQKKITIKFWFNYCEELETLSFEERELLEEKAKVSIFHFIMKDGYTSGELCESLDGNDFYGWWEYKLTNEE